MESVHLLTSPVPMRYSGIFWQKMTWVIFSLLAKHAFLIDSGLEQSKMLHNIWRKIIPLQNKYIYAIHLIHRNNYT